MRAAQVYQAGFSPFTEFEKGFERAGSHAGEGSGLLHGGEKKLCPEAGRAGGQPDAVPYDADVWDCIDHSDRSGIFVILIMKKNTRRSFMNHVRSFFKEEDGATTVEIILIIVVLVSLVIIFKKQLTSLVTNILSKITSQSNSI